MNDELVEFRYRGRVTVGTPGRAFRGARNGWLVGTASLRRLQRRSRDVEITVQVAPHIGK